MLNKVIIIGYVGQEPKRVDFQNGGAVTKITIATTEHWIDKNTNERKEATEWHAVDCFGRTADIASNYLNKGSRVYVEGSLKTEKWEDKDGQKKSAQKIVCNRLILLTDKKEEVLTGFTDNEQNAYKKENHGLHKSITEDDDIPF